MLKKKNHSYLQWSPMACK